jgi:hypothetical protein
LERVEYPAVAFRFQHQQFQECLAASDVAGQLYDLVRSGDWETNRLYVRDYINRPVWEEPFRMVAEEIGMRSGTALHGVGAVAAGAQLIALALAVDPVFAADLARLCGPLVWHEVRSQVGERLRAWYQAADRHQAALRSSQCVLVHHSAARPAVGPTRQHALLMAKANFPTLPIFPNAGVVKIPAQVLRGMIAKTRCRRFEINIIKHRLKGFERVNI